MDFDVIVVGAGAAGAAAAYFLRGAGLRVLVVEKHTLPRYKACGGAIPRQTLARFPFAFDPVIRAAPTAVRFTFPGLSHVDAPLPDRPVVMVRRSEFDAFLLARSDAEVLEGTLVCAVTETEDAVQVKVGENRTLTASYVVGADGVASQVARSLGLRRKRLLGGTLEAEVPLNGGSALPNQFSSRALFSLAAIPWGYAWVFPKHDHLSVGVARLRPGRTDLRAALQRELASLDISLEDVKLHGHALPCYQAPPWPLWCGRSQERLSTRRAILVGDAAGLVDPFIGEGIRYAIQSARLASDAIIRGDLSGYEAAIWRDIGHSLATASLTADLFYRWPKLCFQGGVRNPATIREFVDLLTEKHSYRGIGRRLMASSIRWLVNRRRTAPGR